MSNAMVKPDENFKRVMTMLESSTIQKQIKNALTNVSRFVAPEYLVRVSLTALRNDHKLMVADPLSIVGSVIQLGQVGLVPDGFLGQAYLVPFRIKDSPYPYEAVPMIGYRGFGELAVRSGKATSMDAESVYSNDQFDFEKGASPYLRHKRAFGAPRGQMIGSYAICYMKEGPVRFEIMDMDELMKIKGSSRGSDDKNSPWMTWFDQMARKSPMRRLAKYLPLSPEFQMAAGIDEVSELGTRKIVQDNGEIVVMPQQFEHEQPSQIERPRTVINGSGPAAVQGSEAGAAAVAATESAQRSTQPDSATPAAQNTCLCTCCKNKECTCPDKEDIEQCGCATCQRYMALVKENPPREEAVPVAAKGDKPAGPYVAQSKLNKLFAVCASKGIKVQKDSHDDDLHKLLLKNWNIESVKEIPVAIYDEVLNQLAPELKLKK